MMPAKWKPQPACATGCPDMAPNPRCRSRSEASTFCATDRPTGTPKGASRDTPTSRSTNSGCRKHTSAAQALAACPIDIIVASPLIRALKTAAIVAERLGKPLFVDSALKERHFGAFEGLIVDEVKRGLGLKPHERLVQHLPADAEQWHETGARAARAIGTWLDRHPDSKLLFVTHAGLFDALHERIFGARREPKHVPYLWQAGAKGWTCNAL